MASQRIINLHKRWNRMISPLRDRQRRAGIVNDLSPGGVHCVNWWRQQPDENWLLQFCLHHKIDHVVFGSVFGNRRVIEKRLSDHHRHVFVIFLVSGFWHGANWTFITWGGIHALLFIPLFLRGTNRKNTSDIVAEGRWLPSPRELLQMGWTFTAVTIAWVFFRADNIELAGHYLANWADISGNAPSSRMLLSALGPMAAFAGDWLLRENKLYSEWKWLRWGVYIALAIIILFSCSDESTQFIYFQF